MIGVFAALLLFALTRKLRHAEADPELPSPRQLGLAASIAACSPDTIANLALLGDMPWLESIGVPSAVRARLEAGILRTECVEPANAERLWRERRRLFFKPASGFGSRAAYRGDKLTRRVWQEILAGDYVAQALMPPGLRAVSDSEPGTLLKFDLRAYEYEGRLQSMAARVYQGQTTNFRTTGGGFAPVHVANAACCPARETQAAILG